jgi:esterase
MKLFYKVIGEGQPLFILHGLFGQSDNWNSIGKKIAEQGFQVFLVDLRNHGNSPHSDVWNYDVMSADILELIDDTAAVEGEKIILLGHSMGGKVAMQFAINHPDSVAKLIVADMGVKYRVPDNQDVLNALNSIDLSALKSRKEAGVELQKYLHNEGLVQFLLKNLYWKKDAFGNESELAWKFNWDAMAGQLEEVSKAIKTDTPCLVETLFIRGGNSNYVLDSDVDALQLIFPKSQLVTVEGAGHWLHADKPHDFLEKIIAFVKAV